MSERLAKIGNVVEIAYGRDKGAVGTVLGSHYDMDKDDWAYYLRIPGAKVWKYEWQLKRVEGEAR